MKRAIITNSALHIELNVRETNQPARKHSTPYQVYYGRRWIRVYDELGIGLNFKVDNGGGVEVFQIELRDA